MMNNSKHDSVADTMTEQATSRLYEDEYRTLFENTGTAMATVNDTSVILRCNSEFSKLAGYTVEEICGNMKWMDFVDDADMDWISRFLLEQEQTAPAPPDDFTFTFIARGGARKRVHIFILMNPLNNERICSLIDVTERENTLEALRKSEERYALVAKGANDGFWDWDLTTGTVWYSQRYKAILGYTDEEFPNIPQSWTNAIHPDDYEHALAANTRCLEGKVDQFEVEYRMFHKDGSFRWILGRGASAKGEDGKVMRMGGTHTDITIRKFNERTTNALYAISSAISTTRDPQELYEHIHRIIDDAITADNFFIALLNEKNDSLEFVYFADQFDNYISIPEVSDPDKNSLSIHVFRTGTPFLFSSGDPSSSEQLKAVGVIGTLPATWLGVPLRLRGKTMGAMAVQDYENPRQYTQADVAFMTAVSEQVALSIERKLNEEELELKVDQRTRKLRQQAAELEEANARLLELDQVKSALVSSVSHELRTPLTSVRGFAKLCARDILRHFGDLADTPHLQAKADRIRNNLAIIDMEGERLTRLINDFLDIHRIESGQTTWNDTVINPCDIINKAVDVASGSFIANTDIAITLKLPTTCSPIHADPDKIQQVVTNLLHNAYKFTETGSVTVTLHESQGAMTTAVQDTGSGIAEADIPYLFEKFHKIARSDTVTEINQGTGLGLAICKEIVEHYGGTIWVESTQGQGSCFAFTLPTIWG